MEHTGEMIRAFLAIEIPEEARDWIEQRRKEVARVSKGTVRWVRREGLHVTLHFFGPVPSEAVKKINEIVEQIAASVSPFPLRLKGIGAFPNLRTPRVLWAGIAEEGEQAPLKGLHTDLERAFEESGFPVESRPFSAHVTMGRVRKTLKVAWENFKNLPDGPLFPVNELVLFQSTLTPKGAFYQPLKHFPFGGFEDD